MNFFVIMPTHQFIISLSLSKGFFMFNFSFDYKRWSTFFYTVNPHYSGLNLILNHKQQIYLKNSLFGLQLTYKYKGHIIGTGYKSLGYQKSIIVRQNLSNKYLFLQAQNHKVSLWKKTTLVYTTRSYLLNNMLFLGLKKTVIPNLYKKKGFFIQKQDVFLKQGKVSKT